VVLAFANIDRSAVQADNFKLPGALATLLGLQDTRTYNVKNIAAYENPSIAGMTGRRDAWQWGGGYSGSQLKSSGFFVSLNRVPVTGTSNSDPGTWSSAPFEAQFLKLYDVTPPPNGGTPSAPKAYSLDNTVTFSWAAASDPEGGISGYHVIISTEASGGGTVLFDGIITGTSKSTSGSNGQTLYASVRAVNFAGIESAAATTSSGGVVLLSPASDQDGDGQTNAIEDAAGTNPLDSASVFRVTSVARPAAGQFTVTWSSVAGKVYRVQTSTTLDSGSFVDIPVDIPATGTSTSYTDTSASAGKKFYRVRLVP
jgi:hypothetical protein